MTDFARAVAGPPPLSFSCTWSKGFVTAGQANTGLLELTATSTHEPVPISHGQQLVFLDLPAGWAIGSRSSDWQQSTCVFRGTTLPALTYVGVDKSFATHVHLYTLETSFGADTGEASALGIPVAVTVPASAPDLVQARLQLFDGSGPISAASSVLFNTVEPDAPYVAYANPPGVVLITAPDEIRFPNGLEVTLLSLSAAAGTNVPATLTLQAYDWSRKPVPIAASLATVEVTGGGASWTYTPASGTWTTTIPDIPSQGMVEIAINLLELDQPSIALLAAQLTLNTAGDTYDTIAWFQAYGPYTMVLSLSPSVDAAKYYRLKQTSGSNYAANTLNPLLNSPPLQPNLVDGESNVVYPPIPGWYSWTTTSPDFPSNHPLSKGANELYYLVNAGGNFMPLTTATVDYNFSPEQIYAAGYQQGYGSDPGSSFGPVMPAGAIILWNGAVAQIPPGWALCDGSNGTPNLESKFVVGAGRSEVPNNSGGATSHSHNFNYSGGFTTSTDGNHGHALPSTWYSRNLSCGCHPGIDTNWTTVQDTRIPDAGAHSHSVGVSINQNTSDVTAPRPAWYALCYIMKL